ncbi:MAG: hypothetical protein ABW252_15175 [Polyangiales bacterium]
MKSWWLPMALGAGLLACGTQSSPRVADSDDHDEHDDPPKDDDEDETPASMGGLDAGRSIDAGKRDAGKKRDAGTGMVSCLPDGAVVQPPPDDDDAPGIGAACGSDDDCGGDGLRCLTTVMLPIGSASLTFPGGYCTKACKQDDECGDGAGCPLAMAAQFAADLSNCMTRCESADACRDGYSCSALPSFGGQAPANPQKSCMPPSPFGAGGPRVGGTAPAP